MNAKINVPPAWSWSELVMVHDSWIINDGFLKMFRPGPVGYKPVPMLTSVIFLIIISVLLNYYELPHEYINYCISTEYHLLMVKRVPGIMMGFPDASCCEYPQPDVVQESP